MMLRRKQWSYPKTILLGLGALGLCAGIGFYSSIPHREVESAHQEFKNASHDTKDVILPPRLQTDSPESNAYSSKLPKWHQHLRENPNDEELWTLELERTKELDIYLLQSKGNPGTIGLQLASNLQLQGKAFRHLKRYSEAIGALTTSQQALNKVEEQSRCTVSPHNSICNIIRIAYRLTYSLLVDVYYDLKDRNNAEKYLILELQYSYQSDRFDPVFEELFSLYRNSEDLDKAANTILDQFHNALASKDWRRISVTAMIADEFYDLLFVRISWSLDSHTLREYDARDFADIYGIGIGKTFKYGMVSPDEDESTFLSLIMLVRGDMVPQSIYNSEEVTKRNYDLPKYVREQMIEGNFEPAAKYLFITSMGGFLGNNKRLLFCPDTRRGDVSFNEVEEALMKAPTLMVSASTRNILELFYRGHIFLKTYCKEEGISDVTQIPTAQKSQGAR